MLSSLSAHVSRNRWDGACIVRSMNSRFAVQSSRAAAARDVLRVMLDSYILRKCWIQSSWIIHCVLKHFNLKQLGEIWFQMVQTTPTFSQTSDTVLDLVAVGFLSVGVFCTVCNPTERKPKRRFSMYYPRAQSSAGWPQALGHCSQQLYTLIMMQLACAHLCCTAATGSDRWVLGSWSSSRAFYSNLGAL